MKQKLLSVFSRMGLILFGVIFGLVILEVMFRFMYPDPSPKLINQGLQFHETYGLAFIPNVEGWNTSLRGEYSTYIKINNKGLRGQEYEYSKTDDIFRILVLGDSFTAALQIPEAETFSKLLETQLQQQFPQTKFEVINAGVVGYGTDNQLAYFTHEGYRYQPDLVVLAFFVGNDITDNIRYSLYKLENDELISVKVPWRENIGVPPWGRGGSLFRNIRNFLYLNSRLYSVSIELLTLSVIQKIPSVASLLISMGFVEITQPTVNVGNIYALGHVSEEAWTMTQALVSQLNQEIEAAGSQLLVAILPDESEVDEERQKAIIESQAHLTEEQGLTTFHPTTQLANILEQQGILYVQLLPALQDYHNKTGQSLYYKFDGHWLPAGHFVASQSIVDYLIQNQDKLDNFPVSE